MTRGSAFLIADEYMIESIEFNGDMYRDGLGQDMINMLEKTENVSQFKSGIEGNNRKGLYFIGEVLDVTGHLGGFNFQWAWASAYVAGIDL